MFADVARVVFVQTSESGLARGAPVDRFGLRKSLRGCFIPSFSSWPLKQMSRVKCRLLELSLQVSSQSNETRISQLNGRDQWGGNRVDGEGPAAYLCSASQPNSRSQGVPGVLEAGRSTRG